MGLNEKIDENDSTTFASLGVCEPLCKTLAELKYKTPTNIQKEALPYALQGKDIIGLAETGSGKTAAFAIPVLQALLDNPSPYFCLVLAPTRELAIQINDSFKAIGSGIGVKTCVLVGGLEMMRQSIQLMSKPHIIIATPGRLVDHLQNTKGFNLKNLKYLVFDEADRMLGMEFENDINTILGAIPKERRTYLYSATMTDKVRKLERAALRDPVKVEVSQKYSTVDTLKQQYIFIPEKFKDCYLAFILNELAGRSVIIFTASCHTSLRLAVLLKALGFAALPLSGKMQQTKRLSSLNSFKSGATNVLVCTDVASRGLDIPSVDAVLNYDLPQHSKDYIHRVGRTARAGRSGQAITFVTQYDIEYLQRIEKLIKKKLELYPTEEEEVMVLRERVQQAQRYASMQIKETSMVGFKRSGAFDGNRDLDDDEDTLHDTIAQLSKSRKKRKAKAAAGGASNNKKARK